MSQTAHKLISADDHVEVTHEGVKKYLASKYHDDYDAAVGRFGALMGKTMSSEANQKWRDQSGVGGEAEEVRIGGRDYPSFGRPGYGDAASRLKDLDEDGISASVLYSEVSAFRYLYMLENGGEEATRAFNTSLLDFASTDTSRLIVSGQIPIHDIDLAIAEVKWFAEAGGKSLQLPLFPAELGLPDYWDSRYDRLWATIEEVDLPVCCHIGLNTQLEGLALRDPTPQKGVLVLGTALSTGEALGMFIMGGVFAKFPRLRVVFVEPGLGWVPWWIEMADDLVLRQNYNFPAISELPSHYFHQNVFLTFIDEPFAYENAKRSLGVENVMWSSDYPHPVSSWPRSQSTFERMFSEIPEADRLKIGSQNAERVWRLSA
ncbi:MAG: amidohydrolase family protein [Myxococcota bacterium]